MRITFFILMVSIFSGCGIRSLSKRGAYVELPASEYEALLKDSAVHLIDVRTEKEYEKSHIEEAYNVSYLGGHFLRRFSEMNLDPSKTVLIYCETQHRSLFVARKIYRKGYKRIVDLDRGMMHWRKSGYPFVGDSTTSD